MKRGLSFGLMLMLLAAVPARAEFREIDLTIFGMD
jgi:hypothetical protein